MQGRIEIKFSNGQSIKDTIEDAKKAQVVFRKILTEGYKKNVDGVEIVYPPFQIVKATFTIIKEGNLCKY